MYEQFFGLRECPFGLASNLKYLLLTLKHQEALANLEYGLAAAGSITLLLGEPGTGKTALLRRVLAGGLHRSAVPPLRPVYLSNPRLTASDLFESIEHAFQLGAHVTRSKSRFLRDLESDLADHHERGIVSVLVVDEAQCLSHELLEEVRLLANIETDTEKLLRVVLAGQPALGDRLNEPQLLQLKQRVGLRCTLPALDLRETAAYIAHRVRVAGGDPVRCFSRDAVLTIYDYARGIPRTINVISDNALMTGFATDERPVGARIVLEVCRDFDLGVPSEGPHLRAQTPLGGLGQDATAAVSAGIPEPADVPGASAASNGASSFLRLLYRRR